MKKIIALAIAMIMCLALVGCDGDETDGAGSTSSTQGNTSNENTANSVAQGGSFGVDFGELFGSEIILPDEEL